MRTPHITAIHGAGQNASVWAPLAAALEGRELRALSLPGDLATIRAMADRVEEGLGQPCILMGHSMGALVALEAARHPCVIAVILLGAAQSMPVNPALLQQSRDDPQAAIATIAEWSTARAELRPALEDMMRGAAAALSRHLAACDGYRNGAAAAGALDRPALVIAGAADKMVRAREGEALAGVLRQGRLAILKECGHMMMTEDPAACAAAIEGFLKDISGG